MTPSVHDDPAPSGAASDRSLLASELDQTSYPAFRDRIRVVEAGPVEHAPRSYPGYPSVELPRARARFSARLDLALSRRRTRRDLGAEPPDPRALGRLLQLSHGVQATDGRGPTPSSGKLCALELYLATFGDGWLPRAAYHYDRAEHRLWRINASTSRDGWQADVPSLEQLSGGALLWILVGDRARVERKYGERTGRLLLLEAGHLMQNLCLLSHSLGRCTVPLGGFFEQRLVERLCLPATDSVLYVGVFG
jgi:SagB-type dehydrogenase family enzyme